MNEPSQHKSEDAPPMGENPFASPESVLRSQAAADQWWVPDRPLERPYPPKLCQAAFAVDLAFSLGLMALTAYEVFDRLVIAPQYAAPGLAVRPVMFSMIVGLVMWPLAIVADSLGLLIRRGVWPLGVAAFVAFWVWLGFTLVEWSSGPLPRWYGPLEETLWLGVRVLGNLVWFAAVVCYRLWFAERRLDRQENETT